MKDGRRGWAWLATAGCEFGGEQMLVEFGADGVHVAGLAVAEQVAGAAGVHVGEADGDACAELLLRLERVQAAQRGGGQGLSAFGEKIGVATRCAAPTRPRIWCSWGQAEPVRAGDQDGVGAWMSSPASMMLVASSTSWSPAANPATASSSACGLRRPWAMTTDSSGASSARAGGKRLGVLDPGANDEALAAAGALTHQGFAHDHGIPGEHEGPCRLPADRGCCDDADLA